MKILFYPNWNGHLYLQEETDTSVKEIYSKLKHTNKEIIEIEKNNITKTNKIIENKFKQTLKEETNPILSITGDHSNSYPLIKQFAKKYKNHKIIIFDAHPDVEISTESVSHEDYLRNLIEIEKINPKNIYLFGLRTFSRTELEYLIEKQINFTTITEILKDKNKTKKILEQIKGDIYLSLDIDVLDPDEAPATYYKEWCGITTEELIEFIKIIKQNNLKAIDICEYYKPKDENNITLNNILKLIEVIKE